MEVAAFFQLIGLVWVIFVVIGVLAIALLAFGSIYGIQQLVLNSSAPVVTRNAWVVAKRYSSGNASSDLPAWDTFYVTFESGEDRIRQEYIIPARDYRLLAEGDRGQLSLRGTSYIGFTRSQALVSH